MSTKEVARVVVLKSRQPGKSTGNWSNRSANFAGIPGYRNFYGHGSTKFYVYPDAGWNEKKWGRKPFLGVVWADDEFYAVREAHSKGLVPLNSTFGLLVSTKQL